MDVQKILKCYTSFSTGDLFVDQSTKTSLSSSSLCWTDGLIQPTGPEWIINKRKNYNKSLSPERHERGGNICRRAKQGAKRRTAWPTGTLPCVSRPDDLTSTWKERVIRAGGHVFLDIFGLLTLDSDIIAPRDLHSRTLCPFKKPCFLH